MGSKSPARQKDFADICLKNNFVLADFTGTWVEFGEFLSYLPTLRSQNYDQLLKPGEIQQMRDSRSHYYFEITDVLRAANPRRRSACGRPYAASSSTSARARSSAATRRNSITVRAKAGA